MVFLSAHDDEKDVVEALTTAGACGYLLKSDAPDQLITAVRAVHAGKRYLSPSIAPILLLHITDPNRAQDGSPKLTTREREVLRLVGQGATSKEIAQRLGISPKTAQVHRDNLKQKLNLRTTADLRQYIHADSASFKASAKTGVLVRHCSSSFIGVAVKVAVNSSPIARAAMPIMA